MVDEVLREMSPQFNRIYVDRGRSPIAPENMRAHLHYVTNQAKCHFGERIQSDAIFETCSRRHLVRELSLFSPSLILSFTFRFSKPTDTARWCGPDVPKVPIILRAPHPAARQTGQEKREAFARILRTHERQLSTYGYDVDILLERWLRDAGAPRD